MLEKNVRLNIVLYRLKLTKGNFPKPNQPKDYYWQKDNAFKDPLDGICKEYLKKDKTL